MASRLLQPEMRIVLVGKSKAGKTSVMNTLLGEKKTGCRDSTTRCTVKKEVKHGYQLTLIDTPGVFKNSMTEEEITREIAKCMVWAAPGPHVFLYVMEMQSCTQEDERAVKIFQRIFGEASKDHTIVLLTKADEHPFAEQSDKEDLIKQFGGRSHTFDNNNQPSKQVSELLEKIKKMAGKEEKFYTNTMFEEAQKVCEEQKKEEGKGMTGAVATERVLEQVVDVLLTLTVGEELKGAVKETVSWGSDKACACITQ